jgi:hypothetical protein
MSSIFINPSLRKTLAHDLRLEAGSEFQPLLPRSLKVVQIFVFAAITLALLVSVGSILMGLRMMERTATLDRSIASEKVELTTLRSTVVSLNEGERFARDIEGIKEQSIGIQPLTVRMLRNCEQFGKVSNWDLRLLNSRMNQYELTLQFTVEKGNPLQLLDSLQRAAVASGWQMTRGEPQFNDKDVQIILYFMPKGA